MRVQPLAAVSLVLMDDLQDLRVLKSDTMPALECTAIHHTALHDK